MSAGPGSLNQYQGRWILSQGWVARETLGHLLRQLQPNSSQDLCQLLLSHRLINPQQAQQARAAVQQAFGGKGTHGTHYQRPESGPLNQTSNQQLRAVSRGPLQQPSAQQLRAVSNKPLQQPSHQQLRAAPPGYGRALQQPSGNNFQVPGRSPGLAEPSDYYRVPKPDSKPYGTEAKAAPQAATATHSVLDNSLDKTQQELKIGGMFRDYELLGELSRGAMGVIFHARNGLTDQEVALKFILQQNPNETEIQRFRQEAAALIALNHPHVIEIFDCGSDRGRLFYAMELIEGRDLFTIVTESFRVNSQPPEWEELIGYLRDVADALKYCHEQDLVHRDIKPQNVLIESASGRAVLADFGLLKNLQDTDSKGLTKTGEVVGTPAFMSPEQFAPGGDFGSVGPATDVWGFGAMLFFCFTGQPPFNKNTMVEIFQAITERDAKPLIAKNPAVPEWLSELCASCLTRKASGRPSMAEVVRRLELAQSELSGRGVSAQGRKVLTGVALIVVLGLVALFGMTLLDEQPAELLSLSYKATGGSEKALKSGLSASLTTAAREIELLGQANQSSLTLQFNDKIKVNTDGEGRFKARLKLKEGENEVVVRALDREPGLLRKLSVFVDLEAPSLSFETPEKKAEDFFGAVKNKGKGRLLFVKGGVLKGSLKDRSPAGRVWVEGKPIEVSEKGAFEWPIEDKEEPQRLTLKFEDAVGNGGTQALLVFSPKAQRFFSYGPEYFKARMRFIDQRADDPEQQKLWSIACDLRSWEAAKEAQRRAFVELVSVRMGPGYEALGLERFVCGPSKQQIGAFKHKKTGIVFRLIPGTCFEGECYEKPEDEFAAVYLGVLASKKSNAMLIAMSTLMEPYYGYKNEFAKAFNLKLPSSGQGDRSGFRVAMGIARHFMNQTRMKRYRLWVGERLNRFKQESKRRPLRKFVKPFLLADREVNHGQWKVLAKLPRFTVSNDGLSRMFEQQLRTASPGFPIWGSYNACAQWLRLAGFRLPDRYEWFYAAHGGAQTEFFWGQDASAMSKYAQVLQNPMQFMMSLPRVPKENPPNAFGLKDMIGNVAEWVDPDWRTWQRVWPDARHKGIQIGELAEILYKDIGLSMGGHSRFPPPMCRRDLLVYQLDRSSAAPNFQGIGVRPALSLP